LDARIKKRDILKQTLRMNKLLQISFILLCTLTFSQFSYAQSNLSVNYSNLSSVPDFLNVCGDPDMVAVTIGVDGLTAGVREDIQATLHLFEGVQLVSLNTENTNAGVALLDNSDPQNPIFSIPNLDPNGLSSIQIGFQIVANCAFIDTLSQNDQIQVFDTWEFNYQFNGENLNDSVANSEYRDAFAIPFFTINVDNGNFAAAANECQTRETIINNSGLNGFVDTLYYTIEQESGIHIIDININGTPANYTTDTNIDGDTLYTLVIDGTYFEANGFGDNDGFFDPDEALTITEDYCIVDCELPTGSMHRAGWGCYGEICEEVFATDFVMIGEGTANVEFIDEGSLANEFAGYCELGQTTVTYTNNGVEFDPGFATMFDLEMGIDADGDGFFDDLPIDASVEMTAFYEYDCSLVNDFDLGSSCTNSVSVGFSSRIDYTDACADRIFKFEPNFFRPANTNTAFTNTSDADAFVETDIFHIVHNENRAVRFFETNCNGDEEFRVKVVVPAGVTINLDETSLTKNNVANVPFINSTMDGDTLILTYDASFSPFLNGNYEIDLAFEADCSTQLGPTVFPMVFELYCPECDCTHIWYCGNLQGPQLHAVMPPCPESALLECPAGVQTTEFEVNRTTFGFADTDYTIPFDPADANRKVAISCDSVEMKVVNVVGETPLTDNVGVRITYGNVNDSNSAEEIFVFGEGEVRLVQGTNVTTCAVTANELTVSIDPLNGDKELRFDLSNCLTDNGITLVEGDSIDFKGQFYINPDGPFLLQFNEVPNLRAYGYAIVNGVESSCDNFGDVFTIGKSLTAFDFPSSNNFPTGCQETNLAYRLVTVNNGFSTFFGDEFRAATRVDSIVFDFDTEILDAFDDIELTVSIPGHPNYGNDFYSIRPLSDFPDGHYVATFDTLVAVPSLNIVQTYSFSLQVNLTPTCLSEISGPNGDGVFSFDPTIYYQDRFYANSIGDGSCIQEIIENVDNNITYTEPATFSLNPLSNTNFILIGDTAVWDLQLCNTAFGADANMTWIALEDANGLVEVVAIEDISTPGVTTPMPFQTYNGNGSAYALTGELLAADGNNSFEEICKQLRIKALVSECGSATVQARSGWNCTDFPTDWNPLEYAPCVENNLTLTVTSQDPFLDANIVDQPIVNPEICDTTTVTILLRNTDLGAAFDLNTQITIPAQGATIIPGSVEFAYPSGAAFQQIMSDPVFVNTSLQGDTYEYTDFSQWSTFLDQNGLPGFNPDAPSDENEIRIRYKFLTDCDFLSGGLSYYSFQAQKACGQPSNFEAGETFPLTISGTESITELFDIEFAAGSALSSNATNTLTINVENLSNSISDANDFVRLTLPDGVTYEPGSSIANAPNTWIIDEPTVEQMNGLQILTWSLVEGLENGATASFNLGVNTPTYTCDSEDQPFVLTTISMTSLFCGSGNFECDVANITSASGNQITTLPIGGTLQLAMNSVSSACIGNGQENVTFVGTITSSEAINEILTYNYYQDTNGNGVIDVDDVLIESIMENTSLLAGESLGITQNFNASIDLLCATILQIIQPSADACGVLEMPLPMPTLENVGEDQLFCFDGTNVITTTIGASECNGYDYEWTAIAPAQLSMLSDPNSPTPTVTVNHDGFTQVLQFVLATARPNCPPSLDTVTITLGQAVIVNANADLNILLGESTPLPMNITSGTSPFTYSWTPVGSLDDATTDSPIATPTESTIYEVTVTDASGCMGTSSVNVIVGTPVDAQVDPAESTICSNETVQLTASGGDTYFWTEGANPVANTLSSNSIANPVFSSTTAGVYTFEVTVLDGANSDIAQVTITVLENPVLDAGNDMTVCAGTATDLLAGAIGINLVFDWSPAPISGQNTLTPTVFPTETTVYTLIATAPNGCQSSDQVTVFVDPDCNGSSCDPINLSSIILNPATCNNADGAATLEINGLASDSNYSWTPNIGIPNPDGNARTALVAGAYQVVVTDVNDVDCFEIFDFVIENSDGPAVNIIATPAACNADVGTATLTPANFQYTWSDNGSMTNERTDLAAGTYSVTVIDPADPSCENIIQVFIDDENPLSADVIINTNPGCGEANGSVTLAINGGSGSYTYSWPSNSDTQTNLSSGVYNVTVTDVISSGCELVVTFLLADDVPSATILDLEVTDVACFGNADGAVDYGVEYDPAFTPEASIVLTNGVQDFENNNLPAGNICIVVSDGNGCIAGGECFEVTQPAPLTISSTSSPDCFTDGSIALAISGGTAPYFVDWADLIGEDGGATRTGLVAGVYTAIVRDSKNCSTSIQITVESCPCVLPVVSGVSITAATCGTETGAAMLFLNQNIEDYTYTWVPNLGVSNALGNGKTSLPAGIYTVQVTSIADDICDITTTVIIENSDGPSATAVTTSATCNDSNGTANLLPSNFVYTWPDTPMPMNFRDDLVEGTYLISYIDPAEPNCQNYLEVIIGNDNPLNGTVNTIQAPDCGQANGTVEVVVNGGSGNYAYSWPSNMAVQDGLSAGIYTVTVTDLGTTGCTIPLNFVLSDNVDEATLIVNGVNDVTCFDNSDGAFDFEVSYSADFAFPADTVISNGLDDDFINGMLRAGDYCLAIYDANGCLNVGECFTIASPDALEVALAVENNCNNGGSIAAVVSGGTAPFEYAWTGTTATDSLITQLPDGDYGLTITDVNGCMLVTNNIVVDTCQVCDIVFVDSLLVQSTDCAGFAEICLPISPDDIGNFVLVDNGNPYSGSFENCDFDTISVYPYSSLFGTGNAGPYSLDNWMINGVNQTGQFQDLQGLVDLMNILDASGDWVLSPPFIIGGNSANTYTEIMTTAIDLGIQSTLPYNPQFLPTDVAITLPVGEHNLMLTNVLSGCEDELFINVVCAETEVLDIDIIVGFQDTLCLSDLDLELQGNFDTLFNACEDGTFVNYELLNDTCFVFTGLVVGTETACLTACDDLGICDTTLVNINVIPQAPDGFVDTIILTETSILCFDTIDLDIPGEIVSLTNICEDQGGENILFTIDESTFCVSYTGIEVGTDTACIVACDANGFCDTLNMFITTVPGLTITDTIYIYNDTVTYCIDTTSFEGDIVSIIDLCEDQNGEDVLFEIDPMTYCVTYTGINPGLDTACYRLEDDLGNVYLYNFHILVVQYAPETICDTIFVEPNNVVITLDTSELVGNFVSAENICEDLSTGDVLFSLSNIGPTLAYQGMFIGQDTACIVLCDDLGFCDTTNFCITVDTFLDPPVANPDFVLNGMQNSISIIDIKENDLISGGIDSASIVQEPLYGTATLNPDCSVTYIPFEDICERRDSFIYYIENQNGSDTAVVYIDIECTDITIWTFVTPNGDGANDVFYISEIEQRPNNRLTIYNRWGNLVYDLKHIFAPPKFFLHCTRSIFFRKKSNRLILHFT